MLGIIEPTRRKIRRLWIFWLRRLDLFRLDGCGSPLKWEGSSILLVWVVMCFTSWGERPCFRELKPLLIYYCRKLATEFLSCMLNVTISPLSIFGGGSSQKAFSLVVIGAHSGEKSFNLVQRAAQRGKVCLVEQVPSLMVQLRQCFRDVDNVILVEGAFLPKKITEMD